MQGRARESLISNGHRRYVLGLLVVVGIFAWMDRNVLAILLESIRQEFNFSDTQLGLLGGVAFGLFYATLGFPVAWLADKYNRRNLISVALALWSVMTALCGVTTGFVTLFLARVGVGIGEAGASPPSQSLISDYFPPSRRGFALGIFYLYVPLGFVAGFLAGGWLNEYFDWRTAFLLVGLPGVLLALIVRFTLKEPQRGLSEGIGDASATPTLWSTVQYFWSLHSLRHLPLAGALHGVGAFAAAVWLPSYFIRAYGLSSGEVGTWLALAYGVAGGVGVLSGGYLTDKLVKHTGDERWYPRSCALAILAATPFAVILYLANSLPIALLGLFVMTLFTHMFLGPVTAIMQGLAGLRRRAVVAAFYLFLVNLISTGVGPLFVGMASDYFSTRFGTDSLRYALLLMVLITSIWAAVHFLLATKTLLSDLETARHKKPELALGTA